jgi:ribonuclease III
MEVKYLISDILSQIRLLTVRQKEPYLLFKGILGFYPNRLSLFEQAFRHRSATTHTENGTPINNERLEFLGDAVLDVMVADILFKKFPLANEDFLTRTRSKIVQRQSMNRIALTLGLDKLLISSALPHDLSPLSIYGNALEALIGAIYLDQGYRRCKKFLEDKIIETHIDFDRITNLEENYKSSLLEWCQQEKMKASFQTVEQNDKTPKHSYFEAIALIYDIKVGNGQGLSKKEAQQKAAEEAMASIKNPDKVLLNTLRAKRKVILNERGS